MIRLYHGTKQSNFSEILKDGFIYGHRQQIFRDKYDLVSSWTTNHETAFSFGQFILVLEISDEQLFDYFEEVDSMEFEYITNLSIPLFELENEDGANIKVKNILLPNINYDNTKKLLEYGYIEIDSIKNLN